MGVPKTSNAEEYRVTYEKATLQVMVARKPRLLYKLFGLGEEYVEEWVTVLESAPVEQVQEYLEGREDDVWVRVTEV